MMYVYEIVPKVIFFGLVPLSALVFVYGLVVREKGPGLARGGFVFLVGSLVFAVLTSAMAVFMGWYERTERVLQDAIDNGTSVATDDLVSPVLLNLSSYWWVLGLLALVLIFLTMPKQKKASD
jgi:hypothetical protein